MFIFAFNCFGLNDNDDLPARLNSLETASNRPFNLSFNSITNYCFFTNLFADGNAKAGCSRKIRTLIMAISQRNQSQMRTVTTETLPVNSPVILAISQPMGFW